MRSLSSCLLVLFVVVLSRDAHAGAITFDTADGAFDAGVKNQGWWAPSFSSANTDDNDAYVIVNFFTRSFFTFDLSGLDLTDVVITGATLSLTRGQYSSPNAFEPLGFFDVSTDAATLNNNSSISDAIYDDLGTGVSYGSFDVSAYNEADALLALTFSLNASALADITAAAGGYFSIGGAMLSPTRFATLFGGTSSLGGPAYVGPQTLVLETAPRAVPEPRTLLLLATGVLALGLVRKRPRVG
jgi:hypothetical protein